VSEAAASTVNVTGERDVGVPAKVETAKVLLVGVGSGEVVFLGVEEQADARHAAISHKQTSGYSFRESRRNCRGIAAIGSKTSSYILTE
jgi:hypothetical protein